MEASSNRLSFLPWTSHPQINKQPLTLESADLYFITYSKKLKLFVQQPHPREKGGKSKRKQVTIGGYWALLCPKCDAEGPLCCSCLLFLMFLIPKLLSSLPNQEATEVSLLRKSGSILGIFMKEIF